MWKNISSTKSQVFEIKTCKQQHDGAKMQQSSAESRAGEPHILTVVSAYATVGRARSGKLRP